MDWINIITNLGFPIGLIIAGLVFLNKNGPNFIKAWHEFTLAINGLSSTVAMNSEAVKQQSEESITVQDHLKKAIQLLEEHHANAMKIGDDMQGLKSLFIELAEKIQDLQGEK